MSEELLLSVEDLKTYFYTNMGTVKAVDGVSFSLRAGEALGLAGESGCGKSITCLSILRLVPQPAGRIVGGKVLFEGEDLLTKDPDEMTKWRGSKISMVLQDPLMSLNPVYTIGDQVGEAFRLDKVRRGVKERVIDVLGKVRIPSPAERLGAYPFQFSGGMRQRTAAAIAIARSPKLLIADEPTTSLDVTIQAQFLKLLKEIQLKNRMALILVSHDLSIVAEVCDRVAIMYAGRIVETGSVKRVYENPGHPYTQALMQAIPRLGEKKKRLYQIEGEPPNLARLPGGCSFHPRCREAMDICAAEYPPAFNIGGETATAEGTASAGDGYAACWLLGRGDA
jgi:oligopeptide/dipeptide ABC transporter ATP-binding protein